MNKKFTLQYTCCIASEVAICMGGVERISIERSHALPSFNLIIRQYHKLLQICDMHGYHNEKEEE